MKRNQIIAAMNALPEDCDVEFGVIPLEKLGYGKEAAYVIVSSAVEFDKRFKEASDNCMQSLARLAMQ